MKQNLHVGEGYAPARSNLKKRNIRYISLLAVLTSMCLYARAQEDIEWTPAASGQSAPTAKGLQVGDTVPDVFIPKILRYHRSSAQLSDYRGKVLILDFWSTYCTICIFNMPYLHRLKSSFEGELEVLPVTREAESKITTFFESGNKYKALKGLLFPSVVEDTVLHNLFPTRSLPQLVVIDKEGVIRAFTTAEYLNEKTVGQLIADKQSVYIPSKRDGFALPRLSGSAYYQDVKTHGPLYYSTVVGFTDGVGHDMLWEEDPSGDFVRFSVTNIFIKKLYLATGQFGALPNKHNRTILEVADPERYVYTPDIYFDIDWKRQHWYAYESVLPLGTPRDAAGRKMRSDLDLFLQLESKLEKRPVRCLVLKRLANAPSKPVEQASDLRYLVDVLNQPRYGLPPVIDESGVEQVPWKDVPDITGIDQLAELKRWINRYGLDIESEIRYIDMFVLREPDFHPLSLNELELKAYGFVPRKKTIFPSNQNHH